MSEPEPKFFRLIYSPAKSKETLEKHLAMDIEFYNFVKQRLEKAARLFRVQV